MATSTVEPTAPPPPTQGRGRGRGGLFWAGTALILVGLVLLGYVGWQFFGTNLVSQRKQQQIVARTEQAWKRGAPTSMAGKRDTVGTAEALVRIPRFGKDYVVPVQAGVTPDVLAKGFGRFRSSVRPGQVGNYALAAHRVTHGQPLRRMPDLRPGDRIVVETRSRTFTYRLDTDPNKLIVTFKDIWVVSRLPRNPEGGVEPAQQPGQRLITLTTCAELFHTDNRMIAFGHLVSSRPRRDPA